MNTPIGASILTGAFDAEAAVGLLLLAIVIVALVRSVVSTHHRAPRRNAGGRR